MNEIELASSYIVLSLPDATVEVTITAKVFHDGKLMEVHKTLGITEVRAAFKDAEDSYFPPDAEFTITDKGRAYLDELERQRGNG